MRALVIVVSTIAVGCGAGAAQTASSGTTPTAGPEARQAAVAEVTALLEASCESGVHTMEELLPGDGQILIVGTAGEIMEGRALLDEVNATYATRGIEVRHDCSEVQRWVYASEAADVVWAEESIRTNARFPGIDVSFPSQRTLIFQRTPDGWTLRFYQLAVRLPDEHLDSVYGVGLQTAPAEAPAEPAEPAE